MKQCYLLEEDDRFKSGDRMLSTNSHWVLVPNYMMNKKYKFAEIKTAVIRNSQNKESQNTSTNTSSPKLPDVEEVFSKIMIDYRKSSWLYPPTRNVIKWVLEFIAGNSGR